MFKSRSAAFALAALAVAGPLHAQSETVRLGLQPWLGYGPLFVAEEKGFFDANGVDVDLTMFNWDQDMTAALASGNLDVIATATNGIIANVNQGVDQKGFLIMDVAFEADAILVGEDIGSIADLAGKSVAFETGATSDLLMNYALKEADMSVEDIDHVPMGASEAGLAMIAGRVDAAVTYEPYISAALSQGAGYKVLYTAAEKPGLISDMLSATSGWIDANPDNVQGLIAAWDDAITFIRENPEEGGQIIATAVGSPMEEFQPAFEGVRLYDVAENLDALSGDFQATVQEIGEIMQQTNPGEITQIPAAEDFIVMEHLEAVASR